MTDNMIHSSIRTGGSGRRAEARANTEQGEKFRRRKDRNLFRICMLATCIVAVLFFVYVFAKQMSVKIALKEEQQATNRELQDLQHERSNLEAELKQSESPEYVEQQARSELRMVRKGEVLYVISESPATASGSGETDKETVKP